MGETAFEDRILALFGEPLAASSGVVHVAAVGRAPDGRRHVIRIGEDAPRSATDAFVLSLARARADAIVTTGAILRAESDLQHGFGDEPRAWRESFLGKSSSPALVVLTRGDGLDLTHPALASSSVLIATGREAAERLAVDAAPRGIEMVGLDEPSIRSLLPALERRGLCDVCVEAGPSTSTALYDAPVLVHELLLSTYEEHPLPPALDAGPFVAEERVEQVFGRPASEADRSEESGRWRFARYRRG